MKRESKGQQVKTFQAFVPQPDMSKEKTIIKVYFKADAGLFSIYGPDHILRVVAGQNKRPEFRVNEKTIEASTLAGVMEGFEWADHRYFEILKSEQKKKVIEFHFEANRAYSDGPSKSFSRGPLDTHVRNDMHFSGSPALGVSYQVLWKAGGQYYRQLEPDDPLQRVHVEGTIIDWTEEREAFFEQMRAGLVRLIDRLIDFQHDLGQNADLAISDLLSGQLLLPAPANADA